MNFKPKNIAFAIANSPLFKTAVAGEDPNWGRIAMGIGKSGELVDQKKLRIKKRSVHFELTFCIFS